MNILVIGSKGQLGTELCLKLDSEKIEYNGIDREDVDITSLDCVIETILKYKPSVVINCAAYTQVDKCEDEFELAYAVNAIGARNIAIASERVNAKLVQISTDFVFDGEKNTPYLEFDKVNPLSVYGKSKLAGEEFVKTFSRKYFIIRTSWLYGHQGGNFVKTMLKLSETRSELSVVYDQIGSPTYVDDLIEGIMIVIPTEKYGTYHYSNEGQCSWNEFAKKIFELSGRDIKVNKISGAEFGAPAERPTYSVMNKFMYKQEFDYIVPHWEDSLKAYLDKENQLKKGI